MGIIGKTNGKIRIVIDKLNSKVRVVFNYLPYTTNVRTIVFDNLYNNIRIVVGYFNSKVRILRDNLNSAVQRNAFATAGITIDRFSGSEHWKQCEYKTTY